jgi:Mg-chelatase subunit ChlD
VILCVDASAGWEAVQAEVARYLGTLPERAQFGLVAYGMGARGFKKGLVAASGANRQAAAKWMAAQKLSGRTDVYDGLQLALDLADGGAKRPAKADTIVVVALQRPTEVGLSPTLVASPRQIALEIGRRNALLQLRIHAFGVSGGGQAYYLQKLARAFGGGFRPSGR